MALLLAARQIVLPKRRLPITKLDPLFASLPVDFNLVVADVGSIGGLHRRWRPLKPHLITLNFDPLDSGRGSDRERYFTVLLGSSEGEGTLHITSRGSMSSMLKPNRDFFAAFRKKPADIEIVDSLSAKVTTLDRLAQDQQLWPDALKIDVQGGEEAVLEGAREALGSSVILAEIECSFAERYEGQQTIDGVIRFMREQGFALLDLRRLKRYRYDNSHGIDDVSLGRGMRAGRLAFCDAIFMLEPARLWTRIAEAGDGAGTLGLKAIVLALTYGKADLAAAIFDRAGEQLPAATRDALDQFFTSLAGDGEWTQQLHHDFDAWSQRV